jgi:hypothetical protein
MLHAQENALAAVASVALVIEDKFVDFYDALMPGIKAILIHASAKEHRWDVCLHSCAYAHSYVGVLNIRHSL